MIHDTQSAQISQKKLGEKTQPPNYKGLKAVSATFLLVCFVCLKESTCEKKKNVFYFTLKALFVLEIIKF